MGRLAHLRWTAPVIVDAGVAGYCLVDYSCPDGCATWLSDRYPREVAEGRVRIVRHEGERIFHKTRALNLGAHAFSAAEADYLCFADADTLFKPHALAAMHAQLAAGQFLIASRDSVGRSQRSLSGLLVVKRADFERVAGYDEEFTGWGSEDIALRLKLHLLLGLTAVELDPGLVHAIPHSDRLRTQFAVDGDLTQNAQRNEALLRRQVERWTGRDFADLPEAARALLFYP